MSPFEVYLVGNVKSVCAAGGVFGTFALLGYIFWRVAEFQSEGEIHAPRWLLAFAIFAILVAIVLPDRKTAVAMYVVPKITNNENIQKLPDDVAALLREWLKEFSPKKEDVKK